MRHMRMGPGPGGAGPVGCQAYSCMRCGRSYKFLPSLRNHQKLECGMEPQFACPHCSYRAKRKHHLDSHMRTQHGV